MILHQEKSLKKKDPMYHQMIWLNLSNKKILLKVNFYKILLKILEPRKKERYEIASIALNEKEKGYEKIQYNGKKRK